MQAADLYATDMIASAEPGRGELASIFHKVAPSLHLSVGQQNLDVVRIFRIIECSEQL